MKITGGLLKMQSRLTHPVEYDLPIGDELVPMNPAIGKYIVLTFTGSIQCVLCGRDINKTFFQGMCYPCFLNAPEASECILRPELCRAHEGDSRDMEWSKVHCLQPHVVYLALTSNLKVGVTRTSQIPTRWIDQGAWRTIRLAEPPNRYTAGMIEVALKKHVGDKTFWQRMLKNQMDLETDLLEEKRRVSGFLPAALRGLLSEDDSITVIDYPVTDYADKIKSTGFDKTKEISGVLNGIRGQYLMFDDGRVLNIRKHQGYEITLET